MDLISFHLNQEHGGPEVPSWHVVPAYVIIYY